MCLISVDNIFYESYTQCESEVEDSMNQMNSIAVERERPLKKLFHHPDMTTILPLYLIQNLSCYLTYNDLRSFSCVSRSCYLFIRKGISLIQSLDASSSDFGTDLRGLKVLLNFRNLKRLDLSGNFIDRTTVKIFGELKCLYHLDLSSNKAALPADHSLVALSHLNSLNINDNFLQASHFFALSMLTKLTHLGVEAKHQLTSIPSCFLLSLTKLQSLNVSRNPGFMDDFFQHLGKLTCLKALNLSHCKLGDIGDHLTKLTNLERLNLSRTALISVHMNLAGFTKLKHLDINHNQLGEQGVTDLALPASITTLNISSTGVTLKESQVLFKLPCLREIILFPNPIARGLTLPLIFNGVEILGAQTTRFALNN